MTPAVILVAGLFPGAGPFVGDASAKSPDLAISNGAAKPKKDKNFADIIERVAFRAAKSGNFKASAVFYRRILELEPKRRSAVLGLADSLTALGRYRNAAQLYRDALATDPDDIGVRARLGRCLLGMNLPKQSIIQFKQALEGRKTVAIVNDLGIAHQLAGNPRKAQEYFAQALEIKPGNGAVRNNLAIALNSQGRSAEALKMLISDSRTQAAHPEQRKNLTLLRVETMTGRPAHRGLALLALNESGSPSVIGHFGGPPPRTRLASSRLTIPAGSPIASRSSENGIADRDIRSMPSAPLTKVDAAPLAGQSRTSGSRPAGAIGDQLAAQRRQTIQERQNIAGTLVTSEPSTPATGGKPRIRRVPPTGARAAAADPYRQKLMDGIASTMGVNRPAPPPTGAIGQKPAFPRDLTRRRSAPRATPAAAVPGSDNTLKVATAPDRGKPTRPSIGGFRVQFGAFSTRVSAEAARRKLVPEMSQLQEQVSVVVNHVTKGARASLYKVQTETMGKRSSADALCAKIRSRSGNCFVTRTPPG